MDYASLHLHGPKEVHGKTNVKLRKMDATKMRDLVIKKKLVQRRQIGTNRQREVNE